VCSPFEGAEHRGEEVRSHRRARTEGEGFPAYGPRACLLDTGGWQAVPGLQEKMRDAEPKPALSSKLPRSWCLSFIPTQPLRAGLLSAAPPALPSMERAHPTQEPTLKVGRYKCKNNPRTQQRTASEDRLYKNTRASVYLFGEAAAGFQIGK
jgi:hypothetical protein